MLYFTVSEVVAAMLSSKTWEADFAEIPEEEELLLACAKAD